MCGIIACIGERPAIEILLNGLKRMEYRGYDSAGIGVMRDGKLVTVKKQGKVSNLTSAVGPIDAWNSATVGLAHTRWATHGAPSDRNSHPHCNKENTLCVVHNGIIENFKALRAFLESKGYVFRSDTDTEVMAHLINDFKVTHPELSLTAAVALALKLVEGTFGLVVLDQANPDILVGARRGSPLVLAVSDTDVILASDASAVVEYSRKVVYMHDDELVTMRRGGKFEISALASFSLTTPSGSERLASIEEISITLEEITKGGYDHFMLKEICEQPVTLLDCMRGRIASDGKSLKLGGIEDHMDRLVKAKRLIFAACGTSWHAALVGEYLIEDHARISVEVEYASEFRYRDPILDKDDVLFVISQSGETADTLAALRLAKEKGCLCIGLVNTVGSTIARETDGGVYLHVGPEIGVASTKAFTGQVCVLSMIALRLAQAKGLITQEKLEERLQQLLQMPDVMAKTVALHESIGEKVSAFRYCSNFLFLGRGANFPVALEGALKLKEISYIHAEGYPAAEMKHGPIALIDPLMPVVFIAPKTDALYEKLVSNIEEVKARRGAIIVITNESNTDFDGKAQLVLKVPDCAPWIFPFIATVPLQILAYYVAKFRGCSIDQPRNLAKSVTVE